MTETADIELRAPKSVQMGCNMAKLLLMGIGSVRKCHLLSPHMLVQTELLLMMSLFKHVPWVKWFETHAQILIFRALKAFFARF